MRCRGAPKGQPFISPGRCPMSVNITAVACQITPKALCTTAQGCEATLGPRSDQGFNPEGVASSRFSRTQPLRGREENASPAQGSRCAPTLGCVTQHLRCRSRVNPRSQRTSALMGCCPGAALRDGWRPFGACFSGALKGRKAISPGQRPGLKARHDVSRTLVGEGRRRENEIRSLRPLVRLRVA